MTRERINATMAVEANTCGNSSCTCSISCSSISCDTGSSMVTPKSPPSGGPLDPFLSPDPKKAASSLGSIRQRSEISRTCETALRSVKQPWRSRTHQEDALQLHVGSHLLDKLIERHTWENKWLFVVGCTFLCFSVALISGLDLLHPHAITTTSSILPSTTTSRNNRALSSFSSTTVTTTERSKLVVAGTMSIKGQTCNIAQMNLHTGVWNTTDCVQLSLYNSYSGGTVYSLVGDYSVSKLLSDDEGAKDANAIDMEGKHLMVVGAFDVTYRNSQLTYCSVGAWNGVALTKVGEGLCNSALSKGMKITVAIFAGEKDLYVGGSFSTQVWNGDLHEFVKIYNIAHYNAQDEVWLPLKVGQITCSWCTVTVLALAWDSKRSNLHIGGKFDAIDGMTIPAGMAIYDASTGRLIPHPGGGLSLDNLSENGVATSMQLDEKNSILYVMGSFTRLTSSKESCNGIAAYEIGANRWTCIADPAHSIVPGQSGNMLLTPYGLMLAGLTFGSSTTWGDPEKPYAIALLSTTINNDTTVGNSSHIFPTVQNFTWTWLPGFPGHNLPLHTLSNGFGDYQDTVFIGGDSFVSKWSYEEVIPGSGKLVPITEDLTKGVTHGSILSMSQILMKPKVTPQATENPPIWYSFLFYSITLGSVFGVFLAIMFNKNLNAALVSFLKGENDGQKGISLDTLTYGSVGSTTMQDSYYRAMKTRFVHNPLLLTMIDPKEIYLHRIIGEGTFGRVWSANWKSSSVAVKEFVFAQAAVAGKSSMQKEIIDEIIGEAGMMAMLRHPYVLQLFGCSLTAQAIWIVSELCSLGSLRQVLDKTERELPLELRLQLALHVAEGMTYLHNQDPHIIHRDLKSHNIFINETFIEAKSSKDNIERNILRLEEEFEERDSKETSPINGDNMYNKSYATNGKEDSFKSESTIVAKIGDWGSARAALSGSRTMTHGVGTACWLAPEVIKYARSSRYSDVYSFGIVLWELATREEVYSGLEGTQIIAGVASDNLRPDVPENCPWRDVMVKCWDEIPQNRLSFETIVVELNRILILVKSKSGSETSSSLNSYQKQHNSFT